MKDIKIDEASMRLVDSQLEDIIKTMEYLSSIRMDVDGHVTYEATINPDTGSMSVDSFTIRFTKTGL